MKKIVERIVRLYKKIFAKCTERLVNKLILLFISIIVLIVVALTVISYNIIENESVKSIINNNTNILGLVNKKFDDYFKTIAQYSLPQFQYDPVMNAIMGESEDYTQELYLEDYMRNLFYSRKDIEGIYMYIIEQKKYYYITRDEENIKVRIAFNENIPKEDWYNKTMKSDSISYFQPLFLKSNTGYFSNKNCFLAYHNLIMNIPTRKPKAVISFYFNSLNRDQILEDTLQNEGEHTLFVDKLNQAFYVDNKNFFTELNSTDFFTKKLQNKNTWLQGKEKYMVIYNTSTMEGQKLIKLIPYSQIYKAAQTNRNLSIFIGGIFLFVSVILVVVLSNEITKPLKKLSKKMKKFSEGYFDVEAEVKGRDEIAQLSKQFNLMVTNTNELINEKYKAKLIEKNAILKAMEAEVNPHFLYNALQAISTKALKSGVTDISDMVDALAITFRYCINGGEIVNLSEEIRYVENYLVLQKARFGHRLQVVYELDEAALEIEIPKLSIQALVDNAIKHALEKISEVITINIKVYLDNNNAVIIVKDNGPGMEKAKLEEILDSFNEEWEENKHIGIKNLYLRLQLIFGEKAAMNIKSDEMGTEVTIFIPMGG